MKAKIRDSNIEILRILSMLFIVAHHFVVHGGFEYNSTTFANNLWLQFLSSGGKIGVNVFIMISGYFLVFSKRVETKKVLKLLTQALFYAVCSYLIFIMSGLGTFNIKEFAKCIINAPFRWFVIGYLALYLIHPYINLFVDSIDKKTYKKILVLLTIMLSIIPTITTKKIDEGNLIWFIYIYLIGGYLRKYPIKTNWKASKYLYTAMAVYSVPFVIAILLNVFALKNAKALNYATYLFEMEKITTVLISIFMFLGFLNFKTGYSKIINIIGASTFGVYLIHDNTYMRTILWDKIFHNYCYYNTNMLIPYSIFVVIIVFIICSIIEILRINILERYYMNVIEKISVILDNKIEKFFKTKIFELL